MRVRPFPRALTTRLTSHAKKKSVLSKHADVRATACVTREARRATILTPFRKNARVLYLSLRGGETVERNRGVAVEYVYRRQECVFARMKKQLVSYFRHLFVDEIQHFGSSLRQPNVGQFFHNSGTKLWATRPLGWTGDLR